MENKNITEPNHGKKSPLMRNRSVKLDAFVKKMVALLVLIVGIVISVALVTLKPPVVTVAIKQNTPLVESMVVHAQSLKIPVFTRGRITPKMQFDLIAQAEGTVTYVSENFHSGGYFSKGELLLQIEDTRYRLEMTKKLSAVASATLFLEGVEAKSAVARIGVKKNATAFARFVPQLNEAKAKLAAAEADLAMAKLNLSFTQLKAPFAGRIRNKKIGLNQFVHLGAVLANIYSLEYAEVRLPITDKQLALINLPRQFTRSNPQAEPVPEIENDESDESDESDENDESNNIATPKDSSADDRYNSLPRILVKGNYGGETIVRNGHIVGVEGGLDENQLLYIVGEIKFPFSGSQSNALQRPLEVGLFVEVEVEGKYYERVFTLPRQAVRNESKVWLVDKQGRLKVQTVHCIYRGPDKVYVDKGLSDSDRIVTSALDYVVDGMQVRIITDQSHKTQVTTPLNQ